MADFDAGFKIVARNAGSALARLAGVTVQKWEPIGDTLQTTERLADRAFRARHDSRRFVVYIEAYTLWADSAVWSVLAKSGLLSERERLPTLSLIFVLLPRGYKEQNGHFRLEALEGKPTQQVWFHEGCMWKEKPEPWWEQVPGLMALYPLCNHGEDLPDAVAHAATAIRQHEMDSYRRADLLTTLAIFGNLKDRSLDFLSIIGRAQMRESPFFQQLLEEGNQNGMRKAILQVMELRFGAKAAKEFEGVLEKITHLEQLEELHKLAIKSRQLTQFRRTLSALQG